MDQKGIEIKSVVIDEQSNSVVITYENDVVETLPKTVDTYTALYKDWLVDEPPFISDIFKVQMRSIILASINNEPQCIEDLEQFFTNANIEEVKRFLVYMRKRDLKTDKLIWTKQ